mgnify:FL=1
MAQSLPLPCSLARAYTHSRRALWAVLLPALSSDHSATAQRALELFKRAEVRAVISAHRQTSPSTDSDSGVLATASTSSSVSMVRARDHSEFAVLYPLYRLLLGSAHWNETVCRRRAAALRALAADGFYSATNTYISNNSNSNPTLAIESMFNNDDGAVYQSYNPSTASVAVYSSPTCAHCHRRLIPDTNSSRTFALFCAATLDIPVNPIQNQAASCACQYTAAGGAHWLPHDLVVAFCGGLRRAWELSPPEKEEEKDPLLERAKTEVRTP